MTFIKCVNSSSDSGSPWPFNAWRRNEREMAPSGGKCRWWWWWWCRGRFLISSFSIVSNTPNASYSSWYAFSLSLTVNIMSKNSLNPSSPSEFRSHFEDVKFCQKRLLPCAKSHLLRLQLLFYLEYALSMFEALNGLGWFTTWNQRRKWPSFHKLSIKIETCFFFCNPCG